MGKTRLGAFGLALMLGACGPVLAQQLNPAVVVTAASVSGSKPSVTAGHWSAYRYGSIGVLGALAPGDGGSGVFNPVTSCTVDAVTCVQDGDAGYWQRGNLGYLDAAWAGLSQTGDNTSALNTAGAAATTLGLELKVPCGLYRHNGLVTWDSIQVSGNKTCTDLRSTDTTAMDPQLAIQLTGTNVGLHDMTVSTTWAGDRQQDPEGAGVYLLSATGFDISGLNVTGAAVVGIFNVAGTQGKIHNNTVSNTLADGISTIGSSSWVNVSDNLVVNPGDDGVSIVSYRNNGASTVVHDITESGNQVKDGQARGFSVVGGNNITINGGTLNNIKNACIYVASEAGFDTYGFDGVTIRGVAGDTCGSVTPAVNAGILVLGRSGFTGSNVVLEGNTITGLRYSGTQVGDNTGTYTSAVTLANNHFTGVGGTDSGPGIAFFGCQDCQAHHNKVTNFAGTGIDVEGGQNAGFITLDHNIIKQVNTAGGGSINAITDFNSGVGHFEATFNGQVNGSSTVSSLIVSNSAGATLLGNYGDNVAVTAGAGFLISTVPNFQATVIPTGACTTGSTAANLAATGSNAPFWYCASGAWTAAPH